MNNDITIPAAFYDYCVKNQYTVPIEQEIRSVGKGRQYVITRDDQYLPIFITTATHHAVENKNSAAKSVLIALKKQGVKVDINVAPPSAKPVTRRTAAKATGRDYNRELIVTVTPRGDLILRPVGRRQAEQVALSDVYAWVQRNRCLKIARDKAADRAAAKKAKRAARR